VIGPVTNLMATSLLTHDPGAVYKLIIDQRRQEKRRENKEKK